MKRNDAFPWGLLLTAASVVFYAAVFFPLYEAVGDPVGALSMIPSLAAGWYLGKKGGVVVGVLSGGGLGMVLFSVVMPELSLQDLLMWNTLPALVCGASGYGLGRIRELSAAVQRSERRYRLVLDNV